MVLEVRSMYAVEMLNRSVAERLWTTARAEIWPELGWNGDLLQQLFGAMQQSLFVWSSAWDSLGEWEEGMSRSADNPRYLDWSKQMNSVRTHGVRREVLQILNPTDAWDPTPGQIEVRSSYLVRMPDRSKAEGLLGECRESVWPTLGWSGRHEQVLHGESAQSAYVWSSTWDNIASWESAQQQTLSSAEFNDWWQRWQGVGHIGGPREVFRYL